MGRWTPLSGPLRIDLLLGGCQCPPVSLTFAAPFLGPAKGFGVRGEDAGQDERATIEHLHFDAVLCETDATRDFLTFPAQRPERDGLIIHPSILGVVGRAKTTAEHVAGDSNVWSQRHKCLLAGTLSRHPSLSRRREASSRESPVQKCTFPTVFWRGTLLRVYRAAL